MQDNEKKKTDGQLDVVIPGDLGEAKSSSCHVIRRMAIAHNVLVEGTESECSEGKGAVVRKL